MYFSNINYYDRHYKKIKRVKTPDYRKIVISLTTIPDRIEKIKPALVSLLNQTRRVDEICINIPYKTIKGKKYTIPHWLKDLKNVKIRRVEKDWGPSTKLLPTLIREKYNTIIIVVDDDVIYGSKIIESYTKEFYCRDCKDAITNFGSKIDTNKLKLSDSNGFVPPPHMRIRASPGYSDAIYGHHSFLVTPEMFSKKKNEIFNNTRIFEYEKAPKECRWVDDIWISGWLLYHNVKIWSIGFVSRTVAISNLITSDTISLCHGKNSTNRNNNVCIKWFHQRKGVKYS